MAVSALDFFIALLAGAAFLPASVAKDGVAKVHTSRQVSAHSKCVVVLVFFISTPRVGCDPEILEGESERVAA
jgi:hypothetical protein